MPYKSFVIPVLHAEWAERELNGFISNHRVLSVERQWVDKGANSFWAVWVDYLDSPLRAEPSEGRSTRSDQGLFKPDAQAKESYGISFFACGF